MYSSSIMEMMLLGIFKTWTMKDHWVTGQVMCMYTCVCTCICVSLFLLLSICPCSYKIIHFGNPSSIYNILTAEARPSRTAPGKKDLLLIWKMIEKIGLGK